MEVEIKQRRRADVPTPSAQSRRIGRSRSESSRGRAQPHSTLVCTTRSPRAPHFIYLSHVSRDSAISTPPFVSFRFACPNPPACVPTAPDHSGRRAHAPSTLSRADHCAPWPNAVYTTAFVEPFQLEPTARGSLVARRAFVHLYNSQEEFPLPPQFASHRFAAAA